MTAWKLAKELKTLRSLWQEGLAAVFGKARAERKQDSTQARKKLFADLFESLRFSDYEDLEIDLIDKKT